MGQIKYFCGPRIKVAKIKYFAGPAKMYLIWEVLPDGTSFYSIISNGYAILHLKVRV
jgi:hypothetical protein